MARRRVINIQRNLRIGDKIQKLEEFIVCDKTWDFSLLEAGERLIEAGQKCIATFKAREIKRFLDEED